MTRLQKKCLVAVVGTHLMLVVLLLCSGFIRPRPKMDDTQVLEAIPANLIAQAFRSGVRNAQPPPPKPDVTPPQPPQPQVQPPTPPQSRPTVQPPPEPQENPRRDDTKPIEKPEPRPKREITPDLKLVSRDKPKVTDDAKAEKMAELKAEQKAEQAARKAQQQRIDAIKAAASYIRNNTASSMTVNMPGNSSVAYADYASVVKTVYTDGWQVPDSADNDDDNVKVSVTIESDGRVTDAHIVEKSGDASVDRSVQRTLDRISQIQPFEPGSTDKERTYIINFNLKAKRMLG